MTDNTQKMQSQPDSLSVGSGTRPQDACNEVERDCTAESAGERVKLKPSELDPWAPALEKLPENLTCAAIVDVAHVEYEITEAMVATACVEMEPLQQFPFAARGR